MFPHCWTTDQLGHFVSLITLASLPLSLTPWLHGREFRSSLFDVGDLKAPGGDREPGCSMDVDVVVVVVGSDGPG